VKAGESITLPGKGTMTGPQYRAFNNWKAGTSLYKENDSYTVNGNITFTAQWAYNEVAGIAAYLDGTAGTVAEPVVLEVLLDLADNVNGWTSLLDAINTAQEYVALDLSGSTMTGEFDPGTANTGEKYVVSLVLPDAATSIKAGSDFSNPAFENFTALKMVSGAQVTAVGDYAFNNCTSLASVTLPLAQDIGQAAFANCIGLTGVLSLPLARDIGQAAFSECTGLTGVSLPLAQTIGGYAFYNCTGLTSVTLPLAQTIGDYAFGLYGTTVLTVTLGASPPTLGQRIFYYYPPENIPPPKTVTVKRPASSAVAYGNNPSDGTTDNWGNAFRGKGWDGENYLTGTVNTNITLSFEDTL
jgi:hypothetical protein